MFGKSKCVLSIFANIPKQIWAVWADLNESHTKLVCTRLNV